MTSPSDTLAGRRVLVVGGRGFVGSHIVRALAAVGAQVHVLGPAMAEDRIGLSGLGETIGSLEDRAAIERAFDDSCATDLVSCAGYGAGRLGLMRSGEADADAAMAVNVVGHGRLLDIARARKVRRVVWTSSTVVYGPAHLYGPGRVDEAAARAPGTVYGLTKSLAEDISAFHARRFGLDVVGLRLPLVLGPGLWYEGAAAALSGLFAAARAGASHRLAFHDEPMDLMHVADVADAVLTILAHEGPLATVYNLKGFTARAGDLVRDVGAVKPDLALSFEHSGPPPLLFPLVTGGALRLETGFAARHDRAAFVQAMLDG